MVFLLGALVAGSGFAQSNTTAGLAGVGAGTALGAATGQGGTASSSAAAGGGGGNTPIEIQIMVFKGLQEIAKNVAELTATHDSGCEQALNGDENHRSLEEDRAALHRYGQSLDGDRQTLRTTAIRPIRTATRYVRTKPSSNGIQTI